MTHRLFVAGNWKMHGSLASNARLVQSIQAGLPANLPIDIAILPPFPYLHTVAGLLNDSQMQLGAQNLYSEPQGAFTGEVSGAMLRDVGCHYVLAGHSERRALFHEDPTVVGKKVQAALTAELTPILCVGETHTERLAEQTEAVVANQLQAVLDVIGPLAFARVVIAYEPVWAIGTGLSATPEQAEAVHAFIRSWLIKNQVAEMQRIRILYGGSVKPENAKALFAMPSIDGGLIGGAALNAEQFLAICQAACTVTTCAI